MGVRQLVTPTIDIAAESGYCLRYVDDSVKAPKRTPTALAAFNVEKESGRIRGYQFPVGVWVVGFLGFAKGDYTNIGHVFWAFNHGDGKVEIHDSEVHSGHRHPYNSLAEILAWFGAYAPSFIGWSTWVDGRQFAEEFEDPKPEPTPEPVPTPTPAPGPDAPALKEGDVVVPTRLVSYDGVPLRQWDATYVLTELRDDRAVLSASRGGLMIVWAAMHLDDIRMA